MSETNVRNGNGETRPIAIYYEQQHWFRPLFEQLDARGVPWVKLDARQHQYDVAKQDREYSLIFNRMSPSAWRRGAGHAIFYTLNYLSHLEEQGTRVVNGSRAFTHEISKALQLTLLGTLGLPYPKARVINHPSQALSAAEANRLSFGIDNTALVQEFFTARDGVITRVEVLGGEYLYAIQIHITGDTFDLCPADICKNTKGEELARPACPIDAPKSGLTVEAYEPPRRIIEEVERIMEVAGIEVGGIEYAIDDRTGRLLYYDINALSNFVSDPERVIGFNPYARLADYLIAEARLYAAKENARFVLAGGAQ